MGANTLPAHSPLGASGASRWIVCAGSVRLSEELFEQGFVEEESEYAATGTAAHTLGELCLVNKMEPWELIGSCVINGDTIHSDGDPKLNLEVKTSIEVNKDMADAVAFYLNQLEMWHPAEDRNQGNHWIEKKFHCPDIHEFFYGTSDFIFYDEEERTLHVWDYKHGAGLVVDIQDNPQLMYYAIGALEELGLWDAVEDIVLHIIQPRAYHFDGPHRYWNISPDDLDAWAFDQLIPSMDRALTSRDVTFGEHCRFCVGRHGQCPAVMAAIAEYEELLTMVAKHETDEEGVKLLTPEQLGRLIELDKLAGPIMKAAKERGHKLLSQGKTIPGVKLVASKKNREFKDGAEAAARKTFGKRCMTEPSLKSPAQIDALPKGKEFTARWAYKPKGATTVALDGDPRRSVNRDAKSLFKPVKKGKS